MAEITYTPEAIREYRKAVDWYRSRSLRAANRFVMEVSRVTDRILGKPDQYGWIDDDFRSAVLRKYPFAIVYRTDTTGNILVVAIAHSSREPGYWLGRFT